MTGRGLAALLAVAFVPGCTGPAPSPSPVVSSPTPRATTAPPSAPPSPRPTATPSPTPSPTAAPTSYVSPRGTITVDQPRAFARVTSPLSVSGSASLFEAAFTWRLVDLAGKELAKGSSQASAGAPARGTYALTVTFSVTAETFAYLEVISRSPRDGSIDDEARVPLILASR